MKKCAICGHSDDKPTCPKCGEASWIVPAKPAIKAQPVPPALVPINDPEPAPAPSDEPAAVEAAKAPSRARRR